MSCSSFSAISSWISCFRSGGKSLRNFSSKKCTASKLARKLPCVCVWPINCTPRGSRKFFQSKAPVVMSHLTLRPCLPVMPDWIVLLKASGSSEMGWAVFFCHVNTNQKKIAEKPAALKQRRGLVSLH